MPRLIPTVAAILAVLSTVGCGKNEDTESGKGGIALTLPAPASDSVTGFKIDVCGVTQDVPAVCDWNNCLESATVDLANHNLPNDAGISPVIGHKFATKYFNLLAGNYCVQATPLAPPAGYSENFENFNIGDINEQDDWIGTNNKALVTTSQSKSGTKSHSNTDNGEATRILTGNEIFTDHRVISFWFRHSVNYGEAQLYTQGAITHNKDQLNFFTNNGNFQLMTGSGNLTILSGYVADTWYFVEMEYDVPNRQGRARVNGGVWTNWGTFRMNDADTVSKVATLTGVNSGTAYFDDINLTGGNSAVGTCSSPQGGPYAVTASETTQVALVSDCDRADTGGMNVTVSTNNDPLIESLVYNPSDSVCIGDNLTVTLVAVDPDNDALTWNWSTLPGNCTASAGVLTCTAISGPAGTYDVTAHACDPRSLCAQLTFPIHVSACQ